MRGQKECKSRRTQVFIARQRLLDMQGTASMKSQQDSYLNKACIRTALVDILTQTEESSQSPSLDEELLLAITGCGERENQFSPGTGLQ